MSKVAQTEALRWGELENLSGTSSADRGRDKSLDQNAIPNRGVIVVSFTFRRSNRKFKGTVSASSAPLIILVVLQRVFSSGPYYVRNAFLWMRQGDLEPLSVSVPLRHFRPRHSFLTSRTWTSLTLSFFGWNRMMFGGRKDSTLK